MSGAGGSRWADRSDVPKGDEYDRRFAQLEAAGTDVHGEAGLVESLAEGRSVLDAGCGTGRVAIELARRGYDVTGVDLDRSMLATARRKAPDVTWVEGDLATVELDATFDLIVLAGNVLIFVAPDTEARVLARCARHLRPGGLVVAGFSIGDDGYQAADLDADAADAGLGLVHRWSTWDRDPWVDGGDYQVSVHRRT